MMFERIAPEQHDTLDGVPEPSENPFLVGHEEAAGVIAAAYRAGKLPHALLVAGPQGIGKATLAFHLAYHLLKNPVHQNAPATFTTPDPASPLFRQIAMGAHPAILHLTRPLNDKTKSFKTVLTVDEIRKVNRFLSMTSHDGGYRVVIVDPADDMNTNAANALLKNLEEPPAKTIFILITHSPGSLLPTIRSRCQIIRLSPLDPRSLMQALDNADSPAPEGAEARAALAERAGGSARNAIILTQYGGLEIAEAIDGLLAAPRLDVAAAYKLAEVVGGRDQAIQFDIFNRHVLDLLSNGASAAALAAELSRAKILSDTWQEAMKTISETETYNLDRKQHVLTMIDRLYAVMRM
ncbi:DNA polymerase III subunit delta' [Pseudaminobacter soli (ex Li et al. 2025)]|uniref:DNA polymerase III subunit delta n=1 Tax=Pseudaminobacter soli (ex Li et al. 2025) TaxID=1295366 RepID=A0A2P7SNX4_9HYPH|nr:DNA polymerase III subunit delta' [Mesorhizobium soli]PSJ64194.1 DNA polymerase III subunit delta' [Mesorhizobium soli]